MKNAIAYDRTLEFRTVTKEDANKVFEKKNYSKEDVANFQDYLFNEVCRIAAELDVPIQCHKMCIRDSLKAIPRTFI